MARLLRMKEVEKKVGRSERTIRRLMARGAFPMPIRYLHSTSIGWLESEIDAWIEECIRHTRSAT